MPGGESQAPGSALSPAPRCCRAGSDPTDPRMKQADIYSILNPNLSLQPPSGKEDTPAKAAALPCPEPAAACSLFGVAQGKL